MKKPFKKPLKINPLKIPLKPSKKTPLKPLKTPSKNHKKMNLKKLGKPLQLQLHGSSDIDLIVRFRHVKRCGAFQFKHRSSNNINNNNKN